jgi:hypothetical protein
MVNNQQLSQQQIQYIATQQAIQAQAQQAARAAQMAQIQRDRDREQSNIQSPIKRAVMAHMQEKAENTPVHTTVANLTYQKYRRI